MRYRGGWNGAYQFGQSGIVHVQPYALMYMYLHTTHVSGDALCLYSAEVSSLII